MFWQVVKKLSVVCAAGLVLCALMLCVGAFPWACAYADGTYTQDNIYYTYQSDGTAYVSSVDSTITTANILSSFTVGDETYTVTSIGEQAFNNPKSLTSVTIPSTVTKISNKAFWNCPALTTVEIKGSVTSIGDYGFYNCSALTSVTIPDSVKSIGDYAFNGCTKLESVTIPGLVESIGKGTFSSCTSLSSVTLPDSITSIGENAFQKCSSLTSVNIPDKVKTIGQAAFTFCTSLTSVTIPSSVTSIGVMGFYNCSSLKTVTFEKGSECTNISMYAFKTIANPSTIYLPNETMTGYFSGTNYDSGSTTLVVEYEITDGANGTYTLNKDTEYKITGDSLDKDSKLANFVELKLDGATVSTDSYTTAQGSVIVTLKKEYLDTLSLGEHAVQMVWKYGTADTTLTIAEEEEPTPTSTPPKTGDSTPIAPLCALLLCCGGAALALCKKKVRK